MKITFLGTGTSTGVPEIGCTCAVCSSTDPRDKRMRTSALVDVDGKRLLIDCGPDFRMQMLREKIDHLDAVLITHEHYDHVGGLDDLRPLMFKYELPIYLEENVAIAIRTRMPYAFMAHAIPGAPELQLRIIDMSPFEAAGIKVIPIRLMHSVHMPIVGFRIGNLAYLTDLKYIPEEEFDKLRNLDVLVIEALRYEQHRTHESLPEALENIARIQPRSAYIVHLSHRIGLHEEVNKKLPDHVRLAYDGLTIEVRED